MPLLKNSVLKNQFIRFPIRQQKEKSMKLIERITVFFFGLKCLLIPMDDSAYNFPQLLDELHRGLKSQTPADVHIKTRWTSAREDEIHDAITRFMRHVACQLEWHSFTLCRQKSKTKMISSERCISPKLLDQKINLKCEKGCKCCSSSQALLLRKTVV